MKNQIIFVALIAIAFSACNQAELDRVNREKDSLENVIYVRDSSVNDMMNSFNEVERNLDSVALKQHFIYVTVDNGKDIKSTTKERINAEIANINQLMEKNRIEIEKLSNKLKKSTDKNGSLAKTIATLNQQLVQKNNELTVLNEKLTALNMQVDVLQTYVADLTDQNAQSSANLAQTTAALHTVYYIVGKSKDLVEAKLIDRKGGLLGLGKTSKLSADLDSSKFTRIDYTQVSTIEINGKDIKLITSHPSNSYTMDKSALDKDVVKSITITNPERFWSASKYLVVVKD
jgi:uncharacterized coiled-coil protein SlyX